MSPLSNPEWFSARAVAPGVWRISEPGHVNAWLVEGSERAVIVDSGLGIFGIREVAVSLLADPAKLIGVVNTHSHFDHIGGNQEFDDITIHERGVAQLNVPAERELLDTYTKLIEPMHEEFERQVAVDAANFTFMFTPDEWIRALPEGFDSASWKNPAVHATRSLHDGDRIGLGGRTLEVLHTPGHSPDSVCFWLEGESILFTGDTVCSGRIWAHQEEGDVADFARSTARLAELADDVRLLCMGHHLRPVIEGAYLTEVAEGFAAVVAGDLESVPVDDDFGDPALLVKRGRVEIYLPDPARRRSGVFDEWDPAAPAV
jgi:glyoxylase-like metal-dependent hydrolase (beta-lactamase superfamily II)